MTVPSFRLFERLYRFLAGHRGALFGGTALLVALSMFASSRLHIQEDIVAMLPDDSSAVATDFRLLQLAPFTKKVVITLKGSARDQAALLAAADRLAQELRSAQVGAVSTGPSEFSGNFFGRLAGTLPSLSTAE